LKEADNNVNEKVKPVTAKKEASVEPVRLTRSKTKKEPEPTKTKAAKPVPAATEATELVQRKKLKEDSSEKHVLPPGVIDLDGQEAEDPMMVSEYVVEIFDYMKKLEVSHLSRLLLDQNYAK
jgi:G2/mitotic-specific cyclin 2